VTSVLAFAALSVVLVAIPGPAVMLVLKQALMRGRASALSTALGILVADLIWTLASVVGLTALLVSSQTVFDVVRYLGALYLIYLGARLLLSRGTLLAAPDTRDTDEAPKRNLRGFREGLLSDLSNPKTVIIFSSVIPQFLHAGASPGAVLVLGITFTLIGFASLVLYTLVFSAAAGVLRNPRAVRAVLRIGGSLLVAFGAGLAIERPARS
jgi:threonine/homoserine/homoserine lactone efflux protein